MHIHGYALRMGSLNVIYVFPGIRIKLAQGSKKEDSKTMKASAMRTFQSATALEFSLNLSYFDENQNINKLSFGFVSKSKILWR